jgi:toxin CcdB
MARFDVYPLPKGAGYLLDCQADVLSGFDTRFVVPLLPAAGAERASRLHPQFEVRQEAVVMVTQLAAAVPLRDLGKPIGSLAGEHGAIMNALDMLLTGY